MKKLILASNSPRRAELLSLLDWHFEVIPADINEDKQLGESPVDYVLRLARRKAQVVAALKDGLIIAADTIVVDDDEFLGKPVDEEDAHRMLTQLRGRVHQVFTGIALIDSHTGESFEDVCRTDVPMRDYSDADMESYIATGDPMDKAGGYAIQHLGFQPVEGLTGCFASVMGLPLCHLTVGLRTLGYDVPENLPERCQQLLDYDCPCFGTLLSERS
ncbi:MAG: Maf family protein [Chloroflexota bacterium]|jgi:MAF protein|nr:Maf family protein [Chloroflexota bacterium]